MSHIINAQSLTLMRDDLGSPALVGTEVDTSAKRSSKDKDVHVLLVEIRCHARNDRAVGICVICQGLQQKV